MTVFPRFQSYTSLISRGHLFPFIRPILYKSFARSAPLVVDLRLCTPFIKNHDFCDIRNQNYWFFDVLFFDFTGQNIGRTVVKRVDY